MELDIRTKQDGDVCTITLDGEVDVYTAPRVKEQLVSLIQGGCRNVIVDLDNVGFIDSSGLGVLVSALHFFAQDFREHRATHGARTRLHDVRRPKTAGKYASQRLLDPIRLQR